MAGDVVPRIDPQGHRIATPDGSSPASRGYRRHRVKRPRYTRLKIVPRVRISGMKDSRAARLLELTVGGAQPGCVPRESADPSRTARPLIYPEKPSPRKDS